MSPEPGRRVFFAWMPDAQTKRSLGAQLTMLHARDEPRLRWLPVPNWHITLQSPLTLPRSLCWKVCQPSMGACMCGFVQQP